MECSNDENVNTSSEPTANILLNEEQSNEVIPERRKGSPHAGKLILVTEFCERICYYSISANLLLFCVSLLGINHIDSILIVLVFTGFSYFFSLFAGWIADTFSGKFNALLASFTAYFTGNCILLAIAYFPDERLKFRYGYFIIALIIISFGAGGIKSTISAFGAWQVADYGENSIHSFFNWFYWLINLAALLSFTVIAYLQITNFFYGYLPAFIGVLLALFILVCGRRKFIHKPPDGSHLTDIVRIIGHATSRRIKFHKQIQEEIPENTSLDFLEYAHVLFGGQYSTDQIDIVRCIGRITLVFITMIVYWAIYFQMSSVFLFQSEHFKLSIDGFQIPAASMNLFDSFAVLLLIQIMEQCVYPFAHHFKLNLTTLRRMGFGLFLATLAMIVAGIIEPYRRSHVTGDVSNSVGHTTFNASSYTVFWQAPQFALIGLSEVFTSISGLEFAYSQSPKSLQGLVMSLFLATAGIGAFVSTIIVKIVSLYTQWLCDDINDCQLEYYFFLMAGLSFVNFLMFLVIASNYSYAISYTTNMSREISSHSRLSPTCEEYSDDHGLLHEGSPIDLSYRSVSPTHSALSAYSDGII